MRLRGANVDDAAAIAAVHVAASREAYAGLIPDEVLASFTVEARTEMWRRIVADPGAAGCVGLFVAEDEGGIIGFGSCGRQRDAALAEAGFSGEIATAYVLREHQRRGAGRALMASMARALIGAGYGAASLWVLRGNGAACDFYEALGGEIVGEKCEERPGATLIEVAYGWRDLSGLAR